jgi:hypothetical protein
MSSADQATGSHHDPLDAVIADYLQQACSRQSGVRRCCQGYGVAGRLEG